MSSSPTFAVPEGFRVEPGQLAQTRERLEHSGVEFLLATYVDIHGVPKAKVNPVSALEKMAGGSELFTVGAMEGMGLVGPQEDECAAVPDLDTLTVCPWDQRFAYFFGDLYYHGDVYANDSRQILKRQLEKAAEKGVLFQLGVEPEFYVLRRNEETGALETLHRQRFGGLCPAYDVNLSMDSIDFLSPMSAYLNELGYGLYSFDQEGGHGQYEFDFGYADALTMADRLVFFRLMAKKVAENVGCFASFMPKPFQDDFRSGCHFNMSLADAKTGENLFSPSVGESTLASSYGVPMADAAYHFTAGLLRHAGALTALSSPTYNSYQGFVAQGDMPDVSWAPVLVAYGANNRSAMCRLPLNRYCVENRVPDMSVNPYLAAAFHLAAGLRGIEEKLDPGPPLNEDLYGMTRVDLKRDGMEFLPGTLLHALEALEEDALAEEVLGAEMKEIFLKQKRLEWEKGFFSVSDEARAERLTFV